MVDVDCKAKLDHQGSDGRIGEQGHWYCRSLRQCLDVTDNQLVRLAGDVDSQPEPEPDLAGDSLTGIDCLRSILELHNHSNTAAVAAVAGLQAGHSEDRSDWGRSKAWWDRCEHH